jgi:hypothetical protein
MALQVAILEWLQTALAPAALNSKFSTKVARRYARTLAIVGEWEGMVGDKGLEPLTSPV